MPRMGRVDYPGALHHAMVRGLERKALFSDDGDYQDFKRRLGKALEESKARCLAWALMPNHAHLLIQIGKLGISGLMQRLLTGYGLFFNIKRRRTGYVYQGRFKSFLCEDDLYFYELLRYIHLNPVRAGIVKSLGELARWPWSGHRCLMGKEELVWQDRDGVLARFGRGKDQQRAGYLQFCREGLAGRGLSPDLGGSSLMRAMGGLWEKTGSPGTQGLRRIGEEGIRGKDTFIEEVLKETRELENRRERLQRMGWTIQRVLERAGEAAGIAGGRIRGSGKIPAQSRARALACKWLVEDLGKTTVWVGRALRIRQPSVVGATKRGRILEEKLGLRLEA